MSEFLARTFPAFATMLADDLRRVLDAKAEELGPLIAGGLDLTDAYWLLWDAIYERETALRAEWVISEFEGERVNEEARRAHPEDYDEWLRSENEQLRDLIRRRFADTARELSDEEE